MKKFIVWFCGDRAGRTVVSGWNWLLGRPLASGNQFAVEVAQASLVDMQKSVAKLATSVAQIQSSCQQAKAKLSQKLQEHEQLQAEAQTAQKHGNETAARIVMGQALVIEKLLPQLKAQVERAEAILKTHKRRLDQERQRLENYKAEMQNIRDLAEVNEALNAISEANNTIEPDSARLQFNEAQSAVQNKYYQNEALAELMNDPAEQFMAELKQINLDEEISRRLQQLANHERSLLGSEGE